MGGVNWGHSRILLSLRRPYERKVDRVTGLIALKKMALSNTMAEPKWKQILDRVSEAERNLAKEILRKSLEKKGQRVPEETLESMAEEAVEQARAMVRKKGKETFRGLKAGIKGFWEELKKEAGD